MRTRLLRIMSAALLLSLALPVLAGPGPARGKLLVIGGGTITDEIRNKFIELAGGKNAKLLIIPQASSRESAGPSLEKIFQEKGMSKIDILDLANGEEAIKSIKNADAIWMIGGQQNRLIDRLEAVAGVTEAIRARYQAGATIAGTSAGAAVMSDLMIAGTDLPLDRGLALWPEVIVDQHFVARNRFNRSLRTVLENPTYIGVGIDESTAVIVQNGKATVIGESVVTVIDARAASVSEKSKGSNSSWRNIKVHWLHSGMELELPLKPR